MQLNHDIHLAYCTNIHRGETWAETLGSLEESTLEVKRRVSPDQPYAIGLRLGWETARELAEPAQLEAFQEWLVTNNCYVFTVNGFPYGRFHGTRVKEQVYRPDWTTPERVEYTKLLFDLLAQLVPDGSGGSVSTVPCSFKEFIVNEDAQTAEMRKSLGEVGRHIESLREKTGKDLHLGLEPEPLCYIETSEETARFFDTLDPGLKQVIGVNYDTCHLAIQYEQPKEALERLCNAGIRISKLHLSSALSVRPTPESLARLRAFTEDVYFHQVVIRRADGSLERIRDLPDALENAGNDPGEEWRVHFHIPIHSEAEEGFGNTRDHLIGALDVLKENPGMCQHLEMETYTWEVLPDAMRSHSVVDQLEQEYRWCLAELKERGI